MALWIDEIQASITSWFVAWFTSWAWLGNIIGIFVPVWLYTVISDNIAANVWKVFTFIYGSGNTSIGIYYLLQLRVFLK